MKKSYFLMAAAAALFAACSETDFVNEAAVVEGNAPQAIGFDEFLGKSTRGVNTTNLDDFHAGFGVWAYKGEVGSETTDVMLNYNVVKDGDWVYSGKTGGTDGATSQSLKYWDKFKAYKFYAYAPYNKAVTIENKNNITIADGEYAANENLVGAVLTITEPTTAKYTGVGASDENKTTDWMIAEVVSRNAGANKEVEEVFSHTLSRLIVNLKSTTDATFEINSVSINNVHSKGSYTAGKWTATDALGSISGAKGELVGSSTDPKTYYCMEYLVIPSLESEAAPTFSINYTLNGDTQDVTDVAISGITKFVSGTAYEVTVTIGPKAIEFTAEVEAWDTPTTGEAAVN